MTIFRKLIKCSARKILFFVLSPLIVVVVAFAFQLLTGPLMFDATMKWQSPLHLEAVRDILMVIYVFTPFFVLGALGIPIGAWSVGMISFPDPNALGWALMFVWGITLNWVSASIFAWISYKPKLLANLLVLVAITLVALILRLANHGVIF